MYFSRNICAGDRFSFDEAKFPCKLLPYGKIYASVCYDSLKNLTDIFYIHVFMVMYTHIHTFIHTRTQTHTHTLERQWAHDTTNSMTYILNASHILNSDSIFCMNGTWQGGIGMATSVIEVKEFCYHNGF